MKYINIKSHKSHDSIVYIIVAGEINRCKIGKTVNIKSRLSSLKTSCPCRLDVALCVYGGHELEKRIHKDLNSFRVIGEWFELEDNLASYIVGLAQENSDKIAYLGADIPKIKHSTKVNKYKGIEKTHISHSYSNNMLNRWREAY